MLFIFKHFLAILFFIGSLHAESFTIEGIPVYHENASTDAFLPSTDDSIPFYDLPCDLFDEDEIAKLPETEEIQILTTPENPNCLLFKLSSPYKAIITFNLLHNSSESLNEITSIAIVSDQPACPEELSKILTIIIQRTNSASLELLSNIDSDDEIPFSADDLNKTEAEDIIDSLTTMFSYQTRPASPIPESFDLKPSPNICSTIQQILYESLFSDSTKKRRTECMPLAVISPPPLPPAPIKEKKHQSNACDKSFTEKAHLEKHTKKHSGEGSFKCDKCEMSFTQKGSLYRHKTAHAGEKSFKCNRCDKLFAFNSDLERHESTHTGEKPYQCNKCGISFTKKDSLTRHNRTHTGRKPYQCNGCSKSFAQKSNLKIHKRTHTGERPFKCDECGAEFTQNSNLRRHFLTHTGQKPYECDKCGAKFTQSGHLTEHKRIHTGEKLFNCDTCGNFFTTSSQLQAHKKTHSDENKNPLKRPRTDD